MRALDDPIALFIDLFSDGDQRIAARAYGARNAPAIAALVKAGLLVPDGVIDTTICDACDTYHLVEVVSCGPDGGYGWHCPEAGFVTADPEVVSAISLRVNRVVAAIAAAFTAAFGAQRWLPRPLDGTDAWVVGVWRIAGEWTTVALARGVDSTVSARRIADALATLPQNDAGLVLTAGESGGFEPSPRFAMVPLAASLQLDDERGLAVAADILSRAVASRAGARLASHVGRPSVEAKVFKVLDAVSQDPARGVSEVNSGVLRRAWPEFYPGEAPPNASTFRKYIAAWRSQVAT